MLLADIYIDCRCEVRSRRAVRPPVTRGSISASSRKEKNNSKKKDQKSMMTSHMCSCAEAISRKRRKCNLRPANRAVLFHSHSRFQLRLSILGRMAAGYRFSVYTDNARLNPSHKYDDDFHIQHSTTETHPALPFEFFVFSRTRPQITLFVCSTSFARLT